MQTKLKLSAILLTLFFAIMPLTAITANAMTFDLRIPSYGLYCENQNTDIYGKVKYVIDENGKAVQYSEYTVKANTDLTLYVPFVSKAYELPEANIAVSGKTVNSEICYGEPFSVFTDKLNYDFYSADLDEMTCTIYTLTTSSESFTVEFTVLENQTYIYRLPQELRIPSYGKHFSFTAKTAKPDIPYEILIVNGDCIEFESTAEVVKETVTVKEYINRNFTEIEDYFSAVGNVTPDLLYALTNKAIKDNTNYEFFDFFLDSFTQLRLNAYKIELQANNLPYTVNYSIPVDVQKNTAFKPEIYLTEQTATGNYTVDYTIQLNSVLPFIIESNTELEKQSNYIYTVKNVSEDFYFVFSSSKQPESIYNNNGSDTLNIVLYVVLGVAICALIMLGVYMLLHYKKTKKR